MENRITLYHGSYCSIDKPDLSYCFKNRDFGKGFYLTTDYAQAKRFVGASINKAIASDYISQKTNTGYVSKYELLLDDSLLIHKFTGTDKDWLHCIVAHRKGVEIKGEYKKYRDFDIIVGKVADDNTATQINAYLAGAYGPIGSPEAEATCVSLLLTNRLKDQWCFKTNKALSKLTYIGSDIICLT